MVRINILVLNNNLQFTFPVVLWKNSPECPTRDVLQSSPHIIWIFSISFIWFTCCLLSFIIVVCFIIKKRNINIDSNRTFLYFEYLGLIIWFTNSTNSMLQKLITHYKILRIVLCELSSFVFLKENISDFDAFHLPMFTLGIAVTLRTIWCHQT